MEPALALELEPPPALLIDAHVHLHDCYAPQRFLEHAAGNFERVAREHGWEQAPGVLLLSESAGVDWFGRLAAVAAGASDLPLGSWALAATPDPSALLAHRGAERLLLVSGRQVVTREGLEVLLLATRATVPDRLPIREVLAEGERLGALRVIPWGAGKWLFGRGRLLSELVEAARPGDGFFLGDAAGRPSFWTAPRHFADAARHGIRVLPGTDPLPFPREVTRPGSYGFRLEAPGDLTAPAEGLKSALRSPDVRLTPFGELERLGPFIRNQIAMQRRKRQRRKGGGVGR
ncbi:MAG TPA: hypothetical protein VFG66_14825 [Gemmatimonadales bacterium]|nr:hypothetical protein [Gemmatimonadales bacterium]